VYKRILSMSLNIKIPFVMIMITFMTVGVTFYFWKVNKIIQIKNLLEVNALEASVSASLLLNNQEISKYLQNSETFSAQQKEEVIHDLEKVFSNYWRFYPRLSGVIVYKAIGGNKFAEVLEIGSCSIDSDVSKVMEKVYRIKKPLCTSIMQYNGENYMTGLAPIFGKNFSVEGIVRINYPKKINRF